MDLTYIFVEGNNQTRELTGRIKIGFTTRSPLVRLREVRKGIDKDNGLQFIGAVKGDVEKFLHYTFSSYKIEKEWFKHEGLCESLCLFLHNTQINQGRYTSIRELFAFLKNVGVI